MANRRPQQSGRRMDFGRNDRNKNFGRSGVSPWQGAGPGGGLPNLLPLGGGSTEATLALASNIINLLQPRQNPVPSLLDMPIRRDGFGPNMGRYDRGFVPNRMGNQGNFRRTGNYNRAGERINTNRKPFRPNDGQRQQNKSSPKKEADSKAKPVKESDQEVKEEAETSAEVKAEDSKKEAPKTRYDDINPSLLKCHICNKSMWDGRSFENHLSGRAHAIMMQKTAESYALTADTIRQEIKIREMKRTRKSGQQPARDFYCAMCDMYAADGAIHRTTVGHRKLKKYLHPTCTSCHKEMPTRIELDEHRLTAEHLKNMQDKQETVSKPKPEVTVISTLSMEQSYLRDDRQRWRRADAHDDKGKKDQNKDEENQTDVEIKQEVQEGEEAKEGEQAKQDDSLDNENTVLDYKEGDDLSHVTPDMYPAYSTERGVGASFLAEFRCVQCRLCRKLLDSDETAAVHLRTWRHHQLFLRLLQDSRNKEQEQEQEQEQSPEQEEGGQDEAARECGAKRALDAAEDGNWKRRKTEPTDDDDEPTENGVGDADVAMKEEPADGDSDMPPAEDLEDWAQGDDQDAWKDDGNDEQAAEPQPEPEAPPKAPYPVPAPPAVPASKPRGSPRGRARGRGRGRGRY